MFGRGDKHGPYEPYGFGDDPPLPGWLDTGECIRCRDYPAMRGSEFCGHCYWAFPAEVDFGLRSLELMLDYYAPFSEYLVTQGLATA